MTTRPVLYAEDDENDVFLMERAFGKVDFAAFKIVNDGQEAIDYLASAAPRPWLVLLDINMRRMSGLETLAWIRERSEFRTLPVVMFTSSTQEKDLRVASALQATAYVAKPNSAARLVDIARHLAALAGRDGLTAADFAGLPGYQQLPEPTGTSEARPS